MKQAVVVFHGMGDQTPMSTLNTFVEAAWVKNDDLVAGERLSSTTGEAIETNEVWSKPDNQNRSYELYRLTTGQDKNRKRTDFFEMYWAHHVKGTTWEQVQSWIIDLMVRKPSRVPGHVKPVWRTLWAIILAIVTLILGSIYLKNATAPLENSFFELIRRSLPTISTIIGLITGWLISTIMVKRVGDVVRYTKQKPENIAIRQTIREAGIELIEELNGPASKYDRIVVVAHSLGTIVAYDVLSHAYGRCNSKLNFKGVLEAAKKELDDDPKALATFQHQTALKALEDYVEGETDKLRAGKVSEFNLDTYRRLQRAAQKELVVYECPWKVTDYITLGSPLTHAEFLMADGLSDLRNAQLKRQYPTTPPVQEYDAKAKRFRFSFDATKLPACRKMPGEPRIPHHAAVFGFTRWTNIHSPRKGLLHGDVVSGPIAHLFGQPVKETGKDVWRRLKGIEEISVLPERGEDGEPIKDHKVPFVTHNNYWNIDAPTGAAIALKPGEVPHHIQQLRGALNLLEE